MNVISSMVHSDYTEARENSVFFGAKNMDYTGASCESVAEYIEKYREADFFMRNKINIILRCGAYVGEIIRRNTNGFHWYDYQSALKVNKRLTEGGEIFHRNMLLYHKQSKRAIFPLEAVWDFQVDSNRVALFKFVSDNLLFL